MGVLPHCPSNLVVGGYIEHELMYEAVALPVLRSKLGGESSPTFGAFKNNTKVFWFDKAQENEIYFTSEIPFGYAEGENLIVRAKWVPKDTDTGFVRWAFEMTATNIGGVFGDTITLTTDDAGDGVAYKNQYVDFPTISGSGLEIGNTVIGRIYRDGSNDTYDNDAALLSILLCYPRNMPGARTCGVK